MISLKDYLTSSGRFPERENSPELTPELINNAKNLLSVVNKALTDEGITKADVSSGFRPSGANSKVKGASKKSAHMTCQAIDLVDDKNQTLCKTFTKAKLIKYNLYREDSDYTKGKWTNWCHLQDRIIKSGNRIFKP